MTSITESKKFYEELLDQKVILILQADRNGLYGEGVRPLVEAIILGGTLAATTATQLGPLKTLWQNATDAQRVALAEVCSLQTMVYVLSKENDLPLDVVQHYAEILDHLFGSAFPEPITFASCLCVQKRKDDGANTSRRERGESGTSIWAIALALKAAAWSLGGSNDPWNLIFDSFPITSSESQLAAGVPKTMADDDIGAHLGYQATLVQWANEAMDCYLNGGLTSQNNRGQYPSN